MKATEAGGRLAGQVLRYLIAHPDEEHPRMRADLLRALGDWYDAADLSDGYQNTERNEEE